MKLVVDLTRCQGYAQCAFLAPSVFTMHGDGEALLYDPDPDDEMRERVLRAAAACPVQALVLDRGPATDEDRAAVAATRRDNGSLDEALLRTGRIVIVGASLAGARAAGALRYEGFVGSLTVIGDEAYDPYDRPPLSKQVLEGRVDAEHTGLPRRQAIDADWRLGVAATGLDLAAKKVRLSDGT
ncbi:MAG: ferredoxin, partial [Nocardioidaceae bacterium]